MRFLVLLTILLSVVVVTILPVQDSSAQMSTVFDDVFNGILIDQLVLGQGSTGGHANHFIPAAELAGATLTPALNRMIVQNISSLPLSSSIAGTVYENRDGSIVENRTSWGPIFAETGSTLEKGRLNFGITYTSLQFGRFRGMRTEDIAFSFTHQNTSDDALGTEIPESDVIDVVMDMHIESDVYAITGTYGLASNLDIGVAVPIINLSLKGDARATINSYTHPAVGAALHIFGGTGTNPILTTTESYSESVTGIGDMAIRAKYSFKQSTKEQYGMLLDLRLPTGAEEDFLGSGETNLRVMGIFSRTFNLFTPHINLAYGYRGAEAESDEVAFAVGFDQSVSSRLSFAFDVLGLLPLDEESAVSIAPGSTTIIDNPPFGGNTTRIIEHSNVPNYGKDNIVDASMGFRYAPYDNTIVQANILVPMNDGGLRSDYSLTLGLTFVH